MTFIDDFCGSTSKGVWLGDGFGRCFQLGAICFPCSVLLTCISWYYIGYNKKLTSNTHSSPTSLVVKCRLLITALCMANYILQLVSYIIPHVVFKPVVLLSKGSGIIAWLSFFVAQWCMRSSSLKRIGRGPLWLLIAWLLCYLASIVDFYRQITNFNPHKRTKANYFIQHYSVFTNFGLQTLYLVLLIPNGRYNQNTIINQAMSRLRYGVNINDDTDEERRLLTTTIQPVYSTIDTMKNQETSPLGIAEDNDSDLSRLFFCWVQPMMVRGAAGKLRQAKDLFLLPRKLRTNYIRKRFMQAWTYKDTDSDNTDSTVRIRVSLLTALNRTFGKTYYPLAILKLSSDLLGFTGPLLLHQLVSFVENKNQPTINGYIYAAGLFFATGISAILNTQFTFKVSYIHDNIPSSASFHDSIARNIYTYTDNDFK